MNNRHNLRTFRFISGFSGDITGIQIAAAERESQ